MGASRWKIEINETPQACLGHALIPWKMLRKAGIKDASWKKYMDYTIQLIQDKKIKLAVEPEKWMISAAIFVKSKSICIQSCQ